MTFLFREADERQCRRKNPYENENMESIKRQYRKVSITDDFAALSESGFTSADALLIQHDSNRCLGAPLFIIGDTVKKWSAELLFKKLVYVIKQF